MVPPVCNLVCFQHDSWSDVQLFAFCSSLKALLINIFTKGPLLWLYKMWLSIDLAGMILLCIDFMHRVINKFVYIKDQNQNQFMYYYNANKQVFALEHFERKYWIMRCVLCGELCAASFKCTVAKPSDWTHLSTFLPNLAGGGGEAKNGLSGIWQMWWLVLLKLV